MSAIGPGDFVECVDTGGCAALIVGAVYTVIEVHSPEDTVGGDTAAVTLSEVDPPAPHDCWAAYLFRPIYRPDESLITRLLKDIPAKETA